MTSPTGRFEEERERREIAAVGVYRARRALRGDEQEEALDVLVGSLGHGRWIRGHPRPPSCRRACGAARASTADEQQQRKRDRDPGDPGGDADPELVRVEAQQRVGAGEPPGVPLEEHLVEVARRSCPRRAASPRRAARRRPVSRRRRSAHPAAPRGGWPAARRGTAAARAPRARGHELHREGEPDRVADVLHVCQLAPVEGSLAAGKRGILEQRDAAATGQDRVEAEPCELAALVTRQPVPVGRDAARGRTRTRRSSRSRRSEARS